MAVAATAASQAARIGNVLDRLRAGSNFAAATTAARPIAEAVPDLPGVMQKVPTLTQLPRKITQAEIDAILKKVDEQGLGSLTDNEKAALRARTAEMEAPAAAAPEAAPAALDALPAVDAAPQGEVASIVQIGDGKAKRFVAVDADGNEIADAAALRGGEYRLPDGRVFEADGALVRTDSVGDLVETNAAPPDNLESSGVELGEPKRGGAANLKPKKAAGESKASKLAANVWQITGGKNLESAKPQFLKSLQRQVDQLSSTPQGRAELVAAMGNPEEADRRLGLLAEIASQDPAYAAAKSIDEAAQARAATGVAVPRVDRTPQTSAELVAAREAAAGSLPNERVTLKRPGQQPVDLGDFGSLARHFNSLPEDVRLDVARRLAGDPFMRNMITFEGGAASFNPNSVALAMRPNGAVDEALNSLDKARRTGNEADAAVWRQLIEEAPLDDRRAAINSFTARRDASNALRDALVAADPDVASAALTDQLAKTPAGQPPVRPTGARSVEVAEDIPEYELPGSYEEAVARERERLLALEQRAPGGGMTEADRKQMLGVDDLKNAPIAFKGRDGRPLPLEDRPEGQQGRMGGLPDEVLNQSSIQQTLDDLLVTAVGFRPRPVTGLNRSGVEFTAAERAAMSDDAARMLGESPTIDMMPASEDITALGEGGKRGNLGGRPPASRSMQAIDELFKSKFGKQNPLSLEEFGGDPKKVAADLLTRQSVFKPGTADFDMAVESLAGSVTTRYGGKPAVVGDAPAATTPPDPAPVKAAAKSPEDAKLEASGVELGDELPPVDDSTPAATPAPAKGKGKGGKGKKPAAELADEGDLPPLEAETDDLEARSRASAARLNQRAGKAAPSSGPAAKAEAVPATKADDVGPVVEPDRKADATKPKEDAAPPNEKPDDAKPKDSSPTDKEPEKKAGMSKWGKRGAILVAGAGAGGMLLDGLRSGGGSPINVPVPPGGGGFVPVAGGADAARQAPSEEAINRALEVIRGSRRGSDSPSYQTLQNWTVWR